MSTSRDSRDSKGPVKALRREVAEARRKITHGERPVFHVTWATSPDGSATDLQIRELPIVHLFVPDESGVLPGARALVARTLDVDPSAFDIEPEG